MDKQAGLHRSITRVLLIEDNPGDARLIQELLKEDNSNEFEINWVDSLEKGLRILKGKDVDIVLLDLSLPDGQGLDLISRVQANSPHIAVLVLTGINDMKMSISSLHKGAQDYLVKGQIDSPILMRAMRYARERQRVEEQLRFQKTLLECESEASMDGILIITMDGVIHSWNQRLRHMWHLLDGRLKDKSVKTLFENFNSQCAHEHEIFEKAHVLDSNEAYHDEIALNDSRFFEFHTAPIKTDEGFIYGRAWYFRDITDKKRMESMKDEFISTVSHELRTPLAIIKGAVGNLKDGVVGHLSEKQQRVIETTDRNINRLARLINDLLDISRLESGKVQLKKKRIEPLNLLNDMVRDFTGQAHLSHIDLKLETSSFEDSFDADQDMLIQVMNNLIDNAIRYAKSKVDIFLKQETIENMSMVTICVCDDGLGIAPENLPLLFNKFQQISRPAGGAGYKGTGLGLSISKEIMNLHNGKIWAESTLNAGAQFYISFPSKKD